MCRKDFNWPHHGQRVLLQTGLLGSSSPGGTPASDFAQGMVQKLELTFTYHISQTHPHMDTSGGFPCQESHLGQVRLPLLTHRFLLAPIDGHVSRYDWCQAC